MNQKPRGIRFTVSRFCTYKIKNKNIRQAQIKKARVIRPGSRVYYILSLNNHCILLTSCIVLVCVLYTFGQHVSFLLLLSVLEVDPNVVNLALLSYKFLKKVLCFTHVYMIASLSFGSFVSEDFSELPIFPLVVKL